MKRTRLAALAAILAMVMGLFSGCGGSQKTFGFQLEAPAVGEEIAVMHTTMGDIYIRFFPEEAPKAVENFKTLSKEGYYNGLIFHRVIDNFMIQGGDPKGDGTGGESCWGGAFEDEFSASLGNLRGSLAMANSGEDTNGSQFFINQTPPATAEFEHLRSLWDEYSSSLSYDTFTEFYIAQTKMSADPSKVTDEVLSVYEKTGGNMYLDGTRATSGGHTVFGQVFKGMDVVDAIAAVETNASDKPLEDVKIVSIEWMTYQG